MTQFEYIVKIITDNSALKVKQEEQQKKLENKSEETAQSEEE